MSDLITYSQIRELSNSPANAVLALQRINDLATRAAQKAANDKRTYTNQPTDKVADLLCYADNLGTVLTLTTNSPVVYTWQTMGLVLWLSLGSKEATLASLAGLELGVRINGKQDLMINGTGGGTTKPFSLISPQNAPAMPIGIRVRPGDIWALTLKNTSGGTLTPMVGFGLKIEDRGR